DQRATDHEIARMALRKCLSILSMDMDYARFSLREIPFTVILSGGAQQSMSTATAQLQQLHRLIRVGEISPTVHQRVTISGTEAKVEVHDGTRTLSTRLSIRPHPR